MIALAGVLGRTGGGIAVAIILAFVYAAIAALIVGLIVHFIYPAYERPAALLAFLLVLVLSLL